MTRRGPCAMPGIHFIHDAEGGFGFLTNRSLG